MKRNRATSGSRFMALLVLAIGPMDMAIAQSTTKPANKPKPSSSNLAMQAATVDERMAEGLWPSPKLMESILIRWVDRVSEPYELDDAQRARVHEGAVKRWQPFFEANRMELQPLVNQFLEMRMGLQPPTQESVQNWAENIEPLFRKFRNEFLEGAHDFREVLNPSQRLKFEVNQAKASIGLQFAAQTMMRWKNGEYEEGDLWRPTRRYRQGQQKRDSQQSDTSAIKFGEQSTKPVDQIALEVDAWEKYVVDFAKTYELDRAQRLTADSVLSELRQRAIDHRDRRRSDILRLEAHIAHFFGGETELTKLKNQLVELYGPIDEMFKELTRRIESLPSSEQRTRAIANTAVENHPHHESPLGD